ncbi:MAG: CynX/NimT family MFS transporter [Pararhizobium sp.]
MTPTKAGEAVEAKGQGATARLLLGLGLVLIAVNLRPVFSSASVLLPEIIDRTGISAVGAGALTTLPVLCLGVFAPLAPWLSGRIGPERTLLGVLALLAVGTALRAFGLVPLFLGTGIAGACIAVGNVLLPGLVKRDFSDRAALMTGLYTMALTGGAALGAGLTVPIEHWIGGGFPPALAAWALPAAVVAVVWLPQALSGGTRVRASGVTVTGLWRDPIAWQVTAFMGLQSALAYCVFGWLAPILRFRGLDAATAGAVVSASIVVQVVSCIVVPPIAVKSRDQRTVNVVLALLATVALFGFLFAPLSTVWIWAVIQGAGQGGLIAAAVTMIVLRSPDSHVAAHLSGMAQFVGYLLAAVGPLVVGVIRSVTGGFAATSVLFLVVGLGIAVSGLGAGRSRLVSAWAERR